MTRPNILFILSDQHAQRVTGCYGDDVVRTPNLDRLAARGVTFDNAYAPSPLCQPSRMSMLTGLQPHEQCCWTNDDILPSDYPTMAHSLGIAGYRPLLVGRMHSAGPDQLRGYASRLIGDHSPNWPGMGGHGMGVLKGANDPDVASLERSGCGLSAYEVKDRDVTAAACSALLDIGRRRREGDTTPFAVTVGLMLPHAPYVAQPDDFALYRGRVPAPCITPGGGDHPWLDWWRKNRGIDEVDALKMDRARTAYYALVHRMDAMIGEILATLEAEGLADNTLIIYASDHGEHLGERGLWWKHSFYDESIKVPLIMSWPGVLPEGEWRDQVVNLTSLPATVAHAARAPWLEDRTGKSILNLARDRRSPWHSETYAEYCTDSVPDWTGGMAVQQRMIRTEQWKLIYYHGYRPQLFDMISDPDELRDLVASAEHHDILRQLTDKVLTGWNPDQIARRMRARAERKAYLADWARITRPTEHYRWHYTDRDNRLDEFAAA
jgi:choline-sulfatase